MVNIKDFELDLDVLEEQYPEYVARVSSDTLGDERIYGMLSIIFARQKELMEKYHDIERQNYSLVVETPFFGELDNRRVQIRIKDMMQRTIEEMMEAANTLKNKPWKQDAQITDADHFYEEIADALHFFVEMCIVAGLEAEDLFALYFKKSEVNKFRQRSNY